MARHTKYGYEYDKQSLRAAKLRMAQRRLIEKENNGGRPFKYAPKPGDMDPLF
ncbi:hypothetical protein L3Y21_gp091 [Gordonia phage Rabbitrun]|uniref:Uncharacterized protein n=1 Tax=Gordonia phage Rabbitrun TaxID=2762280 RepID=A0A7G8LIR0_9CAUD|nr:hypothetical protein L3Y21_gp091 [Gordonia phage Rabbitrun]QNJ57132.1 hypothetical protein SEA_RABBITRUN_91 [Gordonia phage Rabbitrun]